MTQLINYKYPWSELSTDRLLSNDHHRTAMSQTHHHSSHQITDLRFKVNALLYGFVLSYLISCLLFLYITNMRVRRSCLMIQHLNLRSKVR